MSYSLIKADNYKAPPGQIEWTSIAGTYTWIVPRGVFAISAVAIGGGGGGAASSTSPACGGSGGDLVYGNVMSVTPGEQLTIVVGGGGNAGLGNGAAGGGGGESYILQNGVRMISATAGSGGVIGVSGSSGKTGTSSIGVPVRSWYTGARDSDISFGGLSASTSSASTVRCTGGGGAAGYGDGGSNLGSAGAGHTGTSTSSTTGGGSGGVGTTSGPGGGGGGTGPWGQSNNGTGVTGGKQSGTGGSGGLPYSSYVSIAVRTPTGGWTAGGNGCMGGLFGGGGAGGVAGNPGTAGAWGARGCVRIIWGDGRQFPSYKAENVDTTDTVVASSQQNYTSPGTYSWVVPVGVYDFSAVCIGGGGPGLQGTNTSGKSGGGGGGLAYANFECVPGETLTVVAGAGGQSTGPSTKVDGGNSSITRNVSFKGFISGTNLYITEIISGLISSGFGLTITGSGVTSCTINAFQTGEQGKVGTYTVSVSQTVGSLASPITFSGTLTLMTANGGTNSGSNASSPGGGGSVSSVAKGSGVFTGGSGGQGATATTGRGQGGGGAAGYGGNGANASNTSASAQNGAYPTTGGGSTFPGSGASGANGGTALTIGAGGGGVGFYGWGYDPNILNFTNTAGPTVNQGYGGSGGTDGSARALTGTGGSYGGGGGGAGSYSAGRSSGGPGAVRITWGRMTYPGPTVDV